jgi:uncharacterized membrane protein YedE/YeeE
MTKKRVALLLMGTALGFSLSRIGFTSFDEVQAMFRFEDLRLFLTFAAGVALLTAAFAIVRKRQHPSWPPRPIHKGTLIGGVLFGVGWALSGACPGVVLTQLGEGKGYALFTLAGVLAGNWLYALTLERRLGTALVSSRR